MDAVEAVARAVQDSNAYMPGLFTEGEVRRFAEAAIAAYRPLIAAECAKVAEDEAARCLEACESLGDDAKADWFAKHREAVLIATLIKETIR